ncbi:MAG TPA: hypothetical protein VFJ43_06620 [Bacteroidia bacterium]|nr:hypothetical protein [Bacteroidia bacterium]
MEQTQVHYPPVTDQQKLIAEATQTASTLKSSGVSDATIYDILVKKGVDPSTAEQITRNTIPAKTVEKSEGRNDMIIGGLWIAGGLILTIGSYMAVSESGGHYFITYGPIIYGVIRFFRGVAKG